MEFLHPELGAMPCCTKADLRFAIFWQQKLWMSFF